MEQILVLPELQAKRATATPKSVKAHIASPGSGILIEDPRAGTNTIIIKTIGGETIVGDLNDLKRTYDFKIGEAIPDPTEEMRGLLHLPSAEIEPDHAIQVSVSLLEAAGWKDGEDLEHNAATGITYLLPALREPKVFAEGLSSVEEEEGEKEEEKEKEEPQLETVKVEESSPERELPPPVALQGDDGALDTELDGEGVQ